MKKIILGLMALFLFVGCSSKGADEKNVEPKLVVGKTLAGLELNNQFEKKQTILPSTTKVIFAFSKDIAHTCNDFFVTQAPTYLNDNKTQFVADVSAAPSIIRSMFIMPGLKDFKHSVIILDDENVAAGYRAGIDVEKIIVVYVNDKKITDIKTVNSENELKDIIENK